MGHGLYSFIPCLGGGNGMEWKGMKIIILKYSFFPLFESFNGGNRSPFPCLGVEVRGNEIVRREHSFLSILLKPQIFIPSEIGRNERE